MPVLELFSHRKRVATGSTPDVFVYDKLPEELRVQIAHIWRDAIGPFYVAGGFVYEDPPPNNNQGWEIIHNAVVREHGVFTLGQERAISERCVTFLLGSRSVDAALDLIEVSFLYIDRIARDFSDIDRRKRGIEMTGAAAIDELNERFRRAGVGYQFEDGQIIRMDSELIHSEVVRPALRYLHQKGFEGPREEFQRAHAHYRNGETKDAITDANNAFESTLKAICDQRRWQYARGARASDLLKVVRANGLLPDYLEASFDQLAGTLKSGLPKVRNEAGAHGQGARPRETPDYVAAYALHLAAAKILLLVEAHKAMRQVCRTPGYPGHGAHGGAGPERPPTWRRHRSALGMLRSERCESKSSPTCASSSATSCLVLARRRPAVAIASSLPTGTVSGVLAR